MGEGVPHPQVSPGTHTPTLPTFQGWTLAAQEPRSLENWPGATWIPVPKGCLSLGLTAQQGHLHPHLQPPPSESSQGCHCQVRGHPL